jgi:hypothetical protein
MTQEQRSAGTQNGFIDRRLRLASLFVLTGLVVEGLSLLWNHPLSFFAFLGIGGLLIFIGILVYLAALVSTRSA